MAAHIFSPADVAALAAPLDSDDRDFALRKAVDALPAKYREALILFYFHEQDVRQAAQSLGVPEGTVKARLARGREMLRRKLRV